MRLPLLMAVLGKKAVAPTAPSGLAVSPISATRFDLAWTDNASNESGYRVYRSTNGVDYTKVGDDLAAGVVTYSDTTISESTIYYYKVAAFNAIGESLSAASDIAFYFADTFDRENGAIGNGWTGATWTIATNKAVNSPTIEASSLTNGDMEAFTDGLADGWAKVSTPTVAQETTIKHGGSSSQKFDASTSQLGITQLPITIAAGKWFVAGAWLYSSGSTYPTLQCYDSNAYFIDISKETNTSWVNFYAFGRATGSGANRFMRLISGNGTLSYYIDDVTFSPVTTGTLFATRDTGISDVDISINLTCAAYLNFRNMGGIVACLDDATTPTNYLHAYYSGATVYLDKVVNGTYSNLITASVSHVTNAVLKLVKDGTSVGVFYNGTQRGETQTVSDVDLVSNTIHGIAGAIANSTIDNCVIKNPT